MNRILLDTSAYSDIARGNKSVLDAIQLADEVCINPIIIGELMSGFAHGTRETDNLKILEKFLESPRCRLLTIGKETAVRYAHIHHALRRSGTPIPANDLWIAATAMEHGLTVVTLDRHFKLIPQILHCLCES